MRPSTSRIFFAVVSLLATFWSCDAFGLTSNTQNKASVSSTTTSRQDFLAAMVGGLATATLASPNPVWAKEAADYVKGSKNDPDVQAKLSLCMYECTKPKGAEQKSRAECLPECKAKCITAKSTAPVST